MGWCPGVRALGREVMGTYSLSFNPRPMICALEALTGACNLAYGLRGVCVCVVGEPSMND